MIEFTVIYNKQKYEVKFPLDETVDALKNHIEKLTGNYKMLCVCVTFTPQLQHMVYVMFPEPKNNSCNMVGSAYIQLLLNIYTGWHKKYRP